MRSSAVALDVTYGQVGEFEGMALGLNQEVTEDAGQMFSILDRAECMLAAMNPIPCTHLHGGSAAFRKWHLATVRRACKLTRDREWERGFRIRESRRRVGTRVHLWPTLCPPLSLQLPWCTLLMTLMPARA